ncbi:uncharacterized protein V1516DRAFT_654765 [Lipomyces oligophaga]|uniref:uncharacterized protein n=1 Tax=Lipomyces oligophaga TaxID=45792 RepID=UPI0034CECF20
MPTELEELVEFLHSPQAMIRTIALQNLVGYSTGPQNSLFLRDNMRPIKDLKIIARDPQPAIVKDALSILANMSEYIKVRNILAEDKSFISLVVNSICRTNEANADLFCILLANLAKDDAISSIFEMKSVCKTDLLRSDYVIDQLLDCFVQGSEKKLNPKASFDYLAFVFSDISRLPEGRKYFITAREYDGVVPLAKLLVFTEFDNQVRRAGVASTIKNSLFEFSAHPELLGSVNLLPYLLLPLAGPEELKEEEMFELPDELQFLPPDKEREPDPEIMCVLVECLVLLGSTRAGRDYLRDKGVYPLIRELHLAVDNDELQETCERFVQLIMADEPGEHQQLLQIEHEESDLQAL